MSLKLDRRMIVIITYADANVHSNATVPVNYSLHQNQMHMWQL